MSAVDLYKANLDVLMGVDSPTSIAATYDPAGIASILYGVFDDVKFQSTKSDPSGNAMTKNSYIIFSISTAPDFDIYDNKILHIGTTNYTIKYKDFDATGIQRLWLE